MYILHKAYSDFYAFPSSFCFFQIVLNYPVAQNRTSRHQADEADVTFLDLRWTVHCSSCAKSMGKWDEMLLKPSNYSEMNHSPSTAPLIAEGNQMPQLPGSYTQGMGTPPCFQIFFPVGKNSIIFHIYEDYTKYSSWWTCSSKTKPVLASTGICFGFFLL